MIWIRIQLLNPYPGKPKTYPYKAKKNKNKFMFLKSCILGLCLGCRLLLDLESPSRGFEKYCI
jgi:hypothetical protein